MLLSSKITQDVVLKYDSAKRTRQAAGQKLHTSIRLYKNYSFSQIQHQKMQDKKRPNSVKKSCNTFSIEVIHYQIKDIWQLYCKTKH